MPSNTVRGANGAAPRTSRAPLARHLPLPALFASGPARRDTQLAGLAARQARRGPGTPGRWSRFLVAHVRWILVVTLAAGAVAWAVAHQQTPLYTAEAVVAVGFPVNETGGTLQAPDMATEKGIVSSGAVVSIGSATLGVPPADLLPGLSAKVPATTFLLQIFYADPSPSVAQKRAQAIARAYVTYRSEATRAKKTRRTAVTTPSATLITNASLPTSPSSPNYPVDIAVALVLGLALGIGSAALRDHLDDRARGPADVAEQAGAPVLALIPAFRWSRRDPVSALVTVTSPGSVPAEAYQGMRTRVLRAAAVRGARTLLVTSPAWEDKGTVAANLAAAMAQSGRTTVLVCADFRWGHAAELFGGLRGPGLGDLLDRRIGLASALQPTIIPGLRLLPPGRSPADPGALLQRPAWRTLLADLRRHADLVIIDAPPLLASPDTGALADLAEMILLVVDARKSARAQLRSAAAELGDAHSRLAGCVLANLGRRRLLQPRPPAAAADGDAALVRSWSADRNHAPADRGHGPGKRSRVPADRSRVPAGQNGVHGEDSTLDNIPRTGDLLARFTPDTTTEDGR